MDELRARLTADKARKRALVAELEALARLAPGQSDAERLKREARARVADLRSSWLATCPRRVSCCARSWASRSG